MTVVTVSKKAAHIRSKHLENTSRNIHNTPKSLDASVNTDFECQTSVEMYKLNLESIKGRKRRKLRRYITIQIGTFLEQPCIY